MTRRATAKKPIKSSAKAKKKTAEEILKDIIDLYGSEGGQETIEELCNRGKLGIRSIVDNAALTLGVALPSKPYYVACIVKGLPRLPGKERYTIKNLSLKVLYKGKEIPCTIELSGCSEQ